MYMVHLNTHILKYDWEEILIRKQAKDKDTWRHKAISIHWYSTLVQGVKVSLNCQRGNKAHPK
jgi:hypothetical protein